MKRLLLVLYVASLLPGLACRHTAADRTAADKAELAALQQTLAKAWLSGDRATVEQVIAPEWKSTGPDGSTSDRDSVMTQVFETRMHTIRSLEITDVQPRVFGDAAVVTGRTHGTGDFGGAAYDVVIRFTDTFVRRDGRWQAVASHSSLLPKS